jgi:hypothetical protein
MSASSLVAVLALAVVLSGCSGASGPRGTVTGSVTVGPTCPVERNPPDPNCADRPLATKFEARQGTSVVASFSSDSAGRFSVPLPPGDYVLADADQRLPTCPDTAVHVVADATVDVDISCDSGIR